MDKTDVIISAITDIKIRGGVIIGYEPNIDVAQYSQDSIKNEYEYEPETNTCILYSRVPKEKYKKFKSKIDGIKIKLKKKSLISKSLQDKSDIKERHMRDLENSKEVL